MVSGLQHDADVLIFATEVGCPAWDALRYRTPKIAISIVWFRDDSTNRLPSRCTRRRSFLKAVSYQSEMRVRPTRGNHRGQYRPAAPAATQAKRWQPSATLDETWEMNRPMVTFPKMGQPSAAVEADRGRGPSNGTTNQNAHHALSGMAHDPGIPAWRQRSAKT